MKHHYCIVCIILLAIAGGIVFGCGIQKNSNENNLVHYIDNLQYTEMMTWIVMKSNDSSITVEGDSLWFPTKFFRDTVLLMIGDSTIDRVQRFWTHRAGTVVDSLGWLGSFTRVNDTSVDVFSIRWYSISEYGSELVMTPEDLDSESVELRLTLEVDTSTFRR